MVWAVLTMFKLALDAGHGLNTPGKRCLKSIDHNETREWFLNARICDKVVDLLEDYDGIAILRVDDTTGSADVPLATRVAVANQWGSDFYLSVHHNAGIEGGNGGGIVAYCHPKAGKESVAWRDELYEALVEHTGLRGNRATPKATADHHVTRNTKSAACLLELGFMDSRSDLPQILTEEYSVSCAEAIVDVIVRRAGLVKKKATDTPDAWAAAAWEKAKSTGVLDGTRPRDPLTRQEFAVVLSKLGLLVKN